MFYSGGMSDLSYAILGTGALGGYYGGRLAHAGLDVHFLLRSDYGHVRQHGLRVDSIQGDFVLPHVQAYREAADLPACDVVVVCLKTTDNDRLAALLEPCVKPDGVVLVLQNGLHPEVEAATTVGEDRVMGGLCFLCSNKVGPGHIHHLDYGYIHMGWHGSPGDASRLGVVVDDFNAAGIPTTAVDDLRLSRWKKLVWNVPYNGLSVVLGQTTDRIMADPATRRRVVGLMREVQTAAREVDGRVIDDAFIETMLEHTEAMEPYKPSMMLDHEAGRAMELQAIFGDPIRAAAGAGLDLPLMRELYEQLREKAGA